MDDSSARDYLPVFQMPDKAWLVLLGADNQWGFEHEGRFLQFITASSCMPLLPMLERSYSEAIELIRAKLRETGKDENLIETFPFDLLIQRALTWETSYWPLLAVQWLEAGYPLSDQFIIDLKQLVEDKHHSQNLRHRAMHLIERYTA
jgi:hypothetical protein